MKREYYALWLHTIPGIGGKSARRLLDYAGTEEAVYGLTERELQRLLSERQRASFQSWRLQKKPEFLYRALEQKKIEFVPIYSKRYPKRLKQLDDAPYALFVRGGLPLEERAAVALIGARNCSSYGAQMARSFAEAFAKSGIQVVSGLARGIDGIAQKSAMEAGGSSYGVLGSGIDVCYPPENRSLYEKCLEAGGVISEYPPGMEPTAGRFPARNRIISGLSDAVLVIEAREKSGTLITVDMALEQGREVFALPGRTTDALSAGCNRLIAQGACMALSAQDIIQYIGERQQYAGKKREGRSKGQRAAADGSGPRSPVFAEREKQLLWQLADAYPKSFGQLYEEMAQQMQERPPVQRVMQYLAQLLVEGYVLERGNGYYYRRI